MDAYPDMLVVPTSNVLWPNFLQALLPVDCDKSLKVGMRMGCIDGWVHGLSYDMIQSRPVLTIPMVTQGTVLAQACFSSIEDSRASRPNRTGSQHPHQGSAGEEWQFAGQSILRRPVSHTTLWRMFVVPGIVAVRPTRRPPKVQHTSSWYGAPWIFKDL